MGPLKKDFWEITLATSTDENTERPEERWPWMNQEVALTRCGIVHTFIFEFPASRTMRNKFLAYVYITQFMVFCYSSPNRLRHTVDWWIERCEEGLCLFAVELWIWGQKEDKKEMDMEDTRGIKAIDRAKDQMIQQMFMKCKGDS